jgi:hypothetical protein
MDAKNFHKYLADKMFKITREDYYGINCDTHPERVNELLTEITNYINECKHSNSDLQQLKNNIIEFIDIRNYQIKK